MAIDEARGQVASLLGCQVNEIVFTSGGTEANNYAIKGVVGAYQDKGNHIITSSVEHPAVIEVCKYLESRGCRVTYLPVDEYGLVHLQQVQDALPPRLSW
jgi:cysteine desulfurase